MKRIYAVLLLLFILLSVFSTGCTGEKTPPVETPTETGTQIPATTTTLSPTFTQIPPTYTQTLTPTNTPSPTPSVTETPTITRSSTNTPSATPPLQPVVDVTVKYVNQLDELSMLSGKLALSKRGLSSLSYLADLSTNEQILLGDPDWDYSLINSVSPDREKIVLIDDKGQNYFADTNGIFLQKLDKVFPSSGVYGWLDNERLILFDDWDGKQYYGLPTLTILLNPYTLETTILEPIYPDLGAVEFNWGISGLTIYHPQIPLVVYPAIKNNQTSIIIFDTEKQQALAEFSASIGATHTPQWSPDGKYLLLTGKFDDGRQGKDQEIHILDTDGRIVFKTLFANHIPREEFEFFSWSPDSQKIAFWIRVFGSKEEQLAILDVDSGIVTQYDLFSKGGWSGFPIWSPDNQFVAIKQATDRNDSKITILHLDSGLAYVYLETDYDLILEGWVK